MAHKLRDDNLMLKAAEFKQVFFRLSIYRLSGGLNSALADNMTHKLLLDSFNIHV
jgi:hypothetical protein